MLAKMSLAELKRKRDSISDVIALLERKLDRTVEVDKQLAIEKQIGDLEVYLGTIMKEMGVREQEIEDLELEAKLKGIEL